MMERVLRAVQAGEQSFQPASDSAEDIKSFQAVADTVIYAHQQGYLRDCRPIFEAASGRRLCVHVLVCSLTHPGREFLSDLDRQHRAIPKVLTDSLYGISSVRLKVVQIQLVRKVGLFCDQSTACEGLR